jgi:hypothetical protein
MKNDMEQQNEDNCINCVMKRIKDEHITPRPKWTFLFHNYSVIAISVSSLIIGTLSFSVFLNTFLTNDWDIYPEVGRTFWEHVLKTFPFFWLFFLCIFVVSFYYAFSSTEKGYHYEQSVIVSLSIAISLFLGTLVYEVGIGEKVDDYLIETIPHYHAITGDHTCLWLRPDRGLLAGMIISTGTRPIVIIDFNGERWIATGTPKMSGNIKDRPGEKIKILGTLQNDHVFDAKEMRLWEGATEQNPCR